MNPIDVKFSFYDDCNVGSNEKKSKFQVENHIRVSK